MKQIKKVTIIGSFAAAAVLNTSFAATLQVGVVAGKTVAIPLINNLPIGGDLAASGAFQLGDVTFTPGPDCHLSHYDCTLLVSVSPNSRRYKSVPVKIHEAYATNTPVFELTVIRPGEQMPNYVAPPKNYALLLLLAKHNSRPALTSGNKSRSFNISSIRTKLNRSGNALFYGVVEPHVGTAMLAENVDNKFTSVTNGPTYQMVTLTNNDAAQSLSVSITGAGASSFSIDNETNDYGANQNCANLESIQAGASCSIIIKGKVGDPSKAPQRALLSISGNSNNVATFTLTNTTYVYAAGGFNTLGNANVLGGDLVAECTAGTCSNALQGTTGNNYASTNFSVGQWINALAVTPAGNLLVGGVFGAIGGATSGATSGTAALLAQCTPGSVTGNSCINQINTGSTTNAYAFNNAYINSITAPFMISANNYFAVGGDFSNIRTLSIANGGRAIVKCLYTGTSSNQNCSNYLSSSKYANNAVSALNYFNSNMSVGGLFTQIAGYPSSEPTSGTTFATCSSASCSSGMGSNNPNSSILGITHDENNLYMGGVFTQIGGYIDTNGGYPLVTCTVGSTTTCSNALSGNYDANGYIQGLAYADGNLYVGGRFSTIGGAVPVSAGNMLAVCTIGGLCSNFITDPNPYASGTDWGGIISAIAIGSQTTITAN